jgi:signal transduction histidine kinase
MVALAFVIPLGVLIRRQTQDRALASAQLTAQSIATAFAVAAGGGSADPVELASAVIESYGNPENVSILFEDGSHAGAPAEPSETVRLAFSGLAFPAVAPGGEGAEVLVPVSYGSQGRAVVRVFVTGGQLRRGVATAWALLAGLGAGLVAAAVVVADRLARSVTRPVRHVAEATRGFERGDRTVRVPLEGPPEVMEVAAAFNDLADRLDDLLTAERESVADLSHRLRTPLTALRLQAETLPDPESAKMMLPEVEELERAVSRLIDQARAPVSEGAVESDLGAVLGERAEFWRVLADDQNRTMRVTLPEQRLTVPVDPDELGAAIDALFENLFSHTPPGTPVDISASPLGAWALAVFEDRGPGFRSTAAFKRGQSGSGSTGLGLDIARRCAETTGGRLTIENLPEGGARVSLLLGRRTSRQSSTGS